MLYEVLAPGYHSPLTKIQIAELFRAGRLRREYPCKPVTQKQWRTVDELFPLLKYRSTNFSYEHPGEPDASLAEHRNLIVAGIIGLCLLATLFYYFAHRSTPPGHINRPRVTETRWPSSSATAASVQPAGSSPQLQPQSQSSSKGADVTAPATTYEFPRSIDTRQAQLAAQQREAEERQRQQVELARLNEERARQEQKARGQNVIFPLDQEMIIDMGGFPVRLRIHDNDVTSFDVWINGAHYRDVPKQKGISHSGTDETLIYNSGRARLFYVWEPSEKVNHCLLRVREE